MKQHKHAALIKQWADGAEIQVNAGCGWEDCQVPTWIYEEYRIKPTELPSGFLPWLGGKCPVKKGTRVDVIYRDGVVLYDLPANELDDHYEDRDASCAFWDNDNMPTDIVAYCVSDAPVVRWLWSDNEGNLSACMYTEDELKAATADETFTVKLEWSRTEFTA